VSNVLIGIIGVILFIGLALAGALFLGPRFQESTNNSKASAVVQAVSQVAQATNMFVVQEGTVPSTMSDLVTSKYLKSPPSNPVSPVSFVILDDDGRTYDNPLTLPFKPAWVVTSAGTNAAVCEAIERQTGNLQSGSPFSTTITGWLAYAGSRKATGCYRNNNGLPGGNAGDYLVYSRI
jgi:type II secretory pathway pseudopilin PulG